MPIVSSFGALKSFTTPEPNWRGTSDGSLQLYGLSQTYYKLYETQPNIRICVDFQARNIAELNRPVYRRVSDTDRERLNGHDLSVWLKHPNPATTQYRLFEDLMTDFGIYFRAYWLKVRYTTPDNRLAIGLVRLPPEQMEVEGGLLPTQFCWTTEDGRKKEFQPSEIVHFSGYRLGISPLETLRRILAEDQAAGAYRESLWMHGGKQEGIWERDSASPDYTPPQIQSWREQWQEYATQAKAGMTAVGQKGWKYRPSSFSSKDSEYIAGGKLRREVCAAAYHIPQPLVGILDHATFSNIKEQHKHLYQDTLGPTNEMIDQEIERQLLIECDDRTDVYIEANINAKLAGTPEERAQAMQLSIGRPWRTVNEGRALDNLPRIDDPELDTVAPQQGGPSDASAHPQDEPPPEPAAKPKAVNLTPVLQATRDRQHARLSKLPIEDRPAAFTADRDRWNRELASDLGAVTGGDESFLAEQTNAAMLTQLESDAMHARVVALERRPDPEPPPPQMLTLNLTLPREPVSKQITLQKDRTGAVTGGTVVETS